MQKNKQAFTLIELLVVVLIIGILAAIALPQYQVAMAKSKYSTLKNIVKSIISAQEVYYLANGKYSNSFEDLDVAMPTDQLKWSTSNQYTYKWGFCRIFPTLMYCENDQTKLYYQVNTNMSGGESAGLRLCGVHEDFKSTAIANRVCQQETGKTDPDIKETGYSIWWYQ
ncbi:MAG: prepilin-type N-terminal cleavage/methylation domain-containing protein [Elusimicrobiaceae bacterium]|nr:prepilin-type N-terminal cleavage/methylation domain-containing protein [Elusimicrobiaceae bacterium]